MSTRRSTLDEFGGDEPDEGSQEDGATAPEAGPPGWTPESNAGACETCGGAVDPGTLRVVGEGGTIPVCHRCYNSDGGSPFRGPATAVRHYRENETDRGATDAVRQGVRL